MHSRLQKTPAERIQTRNSRTTKPNELVDSANQSCLTPELLCWKQCCFTSVKPEREKGNHTHPNSPHSHSARVPLAKAPQPVGALSSLLQPQMDRGCLGLCQQWHRARERARGIHSQQIPGYSWSFTPWNQPRCVLQLYQEQHPSLWRVWHWGPVSWASWPALRGSSALHGFHKQC